MHHQAHQGDFPPTETSQKIHFIADSGARKGQIQGSVHNIGYIDTLQLGLAACGGRRVGTRYHLGGGSGGVGRGGNGGGVCGVGAGGSGGGGVAVVAVLGVAG